MSAITPESYIKLLRCDLTKEHQLTFQNATVQLNYFKDQLSGLVLTASSYQRKDFKVRFPAHIDEIENYNYMLVQNLPYNYKYFYYYITDMQYINDEMTECTIKLDVFQTYQFDFHYLRSFIEREHVDYDSPGEHTIPESLELGEYVVNTYEYFDQFENECAILTASKPFNIATGEVASFSTLINGITTCLFTYICFNQGELMDLLDWYAENPIATLDSIVDIYMIPRILVPDSVVEDYTYKGKTFHEYGISYAPIHNNMVISKPTSLNGYVPKNKKLLTFPFCFLVGSNNSGSSNIYHYEKFKLNDCRFQISGTATPGGSIKMTPSYYTENQGYDEEEGLIGGKFPSVAWISQGYEKWLTQNSLNLNGQVATGLLATAYSIYSGDVSSLTTGILKVANVLQQVYQHSMTPNSAKGNTNGGDVVYAQGYNTFFFYKKSIKREYAKMIDDFFSMYGYKVNSLKVPNITGRPSWNYVKTIDANVESSVVPEKYLNEFKEMLNSGITFWHNPATFRDYSQNNQLS